MILVNGVEGSNSSLMRDTIPKFALRDEEKEETPPPIQDNRCFGPKSN
jgi:hypothetical protein